MKTNTCNHITDYIQFVLFTLVKMRSENHENISIILVNTSIILMNTSIILVNTSIILVNTSIILMNTSIILVNTSIKSRLLHKNSLRQE